MLGEELGLPEHPAQGPGRAGRQRRTVERDPSARARVLRHFRRTFQAALVRTIADGELRPGAPVVTPIREDQRYRALEAQAAPRVVRRDHAT